LVHKTERQSPIYLIENNIVNRAWTIILPGWITLGQVLIQGLTVWAIQLGLN